MNIDNQVWIKIIGHDDQVDLLSGQTITITRNENQIFINNGYHTYEYYDSKIQRIKVMSHE
jgi:hypothetical protein